MKYVNDNIERFDFNGDHYGILMNRPLAFKCSELINEVIELQQNDFTEQKVFEHLSYKYDRKEITLAIRELDQLFCDEYNYMSVNSNDVKISSLYLELITIIDINFKSVLNSISSIKNSLVKPLYLVVRISTEEALPVMKKLEREISDLLKFKPNIVVRYPYNMLHNGNVDLLINCPYEIIIDYGNHDQHNEQNEQMDGLREIAQMRMISIHFSNEVVRQSFLKKAYDRQINLNSSIILLPSGECGVENSSYFLKKHFGSVLSNSDLLRNLNILHIGMPLKQHCGAGLWHIAISEKGKIYPCRRFLEAGVFEYRTEEITTKMYKDIATINVDTKEECKSCWAKYSCGGGCMFLSYNKLNTLNSIDDSKCENIRNNIKSSAILSSGISSMLKILMKRNLYFYNLHHGHVFDNVTSPDSKFYLKSHGMSMYPLITPNSDLLLEFGHFKDLKVGDLITFIDGNKIITHRLMIKVRMAGDYYIVEKGDNSFFNVIKPEKFMGKILSIELAGTNNRIPTNGFVFVLLQKIVVVCTIIFWTVLLFIKYGMSLTSSLIKQKFSLKRAVQKVFSNEKFTIHSERLLRISNIPVYILDKIIIAFYNIRGRKWNQNITERKYTNTQQKINT